MPILRRRSRRSRSDMRWRCRLEGGPYDGDRGSFMDREALLEKMWVYRCPDCKGIHWSVDEEFKSEVYVFDRMEDSAAHGHVAVYVHADIDLTDLPVIRECVETPTPA